MDAMARRIFQRHHESLWCSAVQLSALQLHRAGGKEFIACKLSLSAVCWILVRCFSGLRTAFQDKCDASHWGAAYIMGGIGDPCDSTCSTVCRVASAAGANASPCTRGALMIDFPPVCAALLLQSAQSDEFVAERVIRAKSRLCGRHCGESRVVWFVSLSLSPKTLEKHRSFEDLFARALFCCYRFRSLFPLFQSPVVFSILAL